MAGETDQTQDPVKLSTQPHDTDIWLSVTALAEIFRFAGSRG